MIRLFSYSNKLVPKSSLHSCLYKQYHSSKPVMNAPMLEPPKTNVPIFMPKKPKKDEIRDLILEVFNTVHPSKREVQSYINRFAIPVTKSETLHNSLDKKKSIVSSVISGKDVHLKLPQHSLLPLTPRKIEFVNSLFETKFEHIALIKIQGPLTPLDQKSVAKTLIHLQHLGLMPIAVLDNDEWQEMFKEGPCRLNELKKWMIEDSINFSKALEDAGGRATPIYNDIFTLTHDKDDHKKLTLSTDDDAKINVSLSWLKTTLKLGHIPLILPIASDGLSMQRMIQPNSGMIALSQSLSNLSDTACLDLKTPHLEPMKIIVINSEGGIPSEERKGSHVFINIQQEYDDIKDSFKKNPQWNFTHPTSLENFEMIKTCLQKLPSTSSAIMVPAYFPSGLIYNLFTDKPLFSSSLPLLAPTTPSTNTTLIRHGMPVLYHNSLSTIDMPSLKSLIESSFERKLDMENYISRLEKCLDLIIVTGDYQGAAIVTMEDVDGIKKGDVAYLDKFAVSPKNRGIGIADILWKQLQIRYPNLMWRSRGDNGVNKWYFERSDGNYRVPGTNWVMFWCGRDGVNKLNSYAKVTENIPPSFLS